MLEMLRAWRSAAVAALLLFGGELAGAEAAPALPAGGAGAAQTDQTREAEKLIADFVSLPIPEPTPAEGAGIQRVLKDFTSEDFQVREAASAAAVKLGTAALPAMRRAAAGPDLEVAERAKQAATAIEQAARAAVIAGLRKLPEVAPALVSRKLEAAKRTWADLALSVPAAERGGKEAEVARLKAEMAAAGTRVELLRAIEEQLLQAPPAEARPTAAKAALP